MAIPTKRTSAVKIMLHPDMNEKLRALAEELGQSPSTLASVAVSLYVSQITASMGATGRAVERMVAEVTPHVQKSLEGLK